MIYYIIRSSNSDYSKYSKSWRNIIMIVLVLAIIIIIVDNILRNDIKCSSNSNSDNDYKCSNYNKIIIIMVLHHQK